MKKLILVTAPDENGNTMFGKLLLEYLQISPGIDQKKFIDFDFPGYVNRQEVWEKVRPEFNENPQHTIIVYTGGNLHSPLQDREAICCRAVCLDPIYKHARAIIDPFDFNEVIIFVAGGIIEIAKFEREKKER